MGLLACFCSTPATKGDAATSEAPYVQANGKRVQQPDLEKSDSAYIGRPDLDTLIKQTGYDEKISAEYSTAESAEGNAAALERYGPPKPVCNQERLQNIEELNCERLASGDPQIKHIMQLMCTVFNTPSALVALVGDDSIYIADAINFKTGDFPWRMSFCAHSLTPPNHQVLVVEDAAADSRFKHLPVVTEGLVRFYAGTPIVSSRGHRLGTVCFACDKPRKFDAEGCTMLTNMGELITRELESEWAAKQQAKALGSKNSGEQHLIRAIECFSDAVMFIDVAAPGWKIMHLNNAAQTRLKLHDVAVNTEEGSESKLWDLFQLTSPVKGSKVEWQGHEDDIKHGRKFKITCALGRLKSHGSAPQPIFNLTFRCAANDVMDSNTALVGAPAYMPTTASNHNYYFATLSFDQGSQSGNSMNSIRSQINGNPDPQSAPFSDLELGPLLGKGGFGRVYRGFRDGSLLAVKVISSIETVKMLDGEPLEFAITKSVKHPNIVATLDYAFTNEAGESESDIGQEGLNSSNSVRKASRNAEMWMLHDFCDCGSLQEASDKGFFRSGGKPNFAFILSAAQDIASGMSFLHSRGVVHGDLTGGNVLLATADDTPSGVVAKIADFGLARSMDVKSKIETRTYGTVTHMPPELLEKGIFSKAADTFALGVLMWEMYHGVRAWSSMNHAQIITAVAVNKNSLKFPKDAPEPYVKLATSLMSPTPEARPTFEETLLSIKQLQTVLK